MIKRSEIARNGPWGRDIAFAGEQHPPPRRLLVLAIIAIFLFVAALLEIPGYLQKWLWMRELVIVEAKAALDRARSGAAKLAFWMMAALFFGDFASSLAAVEGGQLRDGTWQNRRLVPRPW